MCPSALGLPGALNQAEMAHNKGETVYESSMQEGWPTMEQIAAIYGLIHYLTNKGHMHTFTDIVSALPQLPHLQPHACKEGSQTQ